MILFDGHDIGGLFLCGDPQVTALSFENDTRALQGGGSAFVGTRMASTSVKFTAAAIGTLSERRLALSTLGEWLAVDEPKWLELPDMPGWRYKALPDGDISPTRHLDGEAFELSFMLVDPIAYGAQREITVPSGGSVEFVVGGTYPAKPAITAASAVRDSSSQVWGVRLDEGDFVHVATGSASARGVAIDCGERTCAVNGSATLPTLDSDWLELSPGKHTLRMDKGTGAATVTFAERWL